MFGIWNVLLGSKLLLVRTNTHITLGCLSAPSLMLTICNSLGRPRCLKVVRAWTLQNITSWMRRRVSKHADYRKDGEKWTVSLALAASALGQTPGSRQYIIDAKPTTFNYRRRISFSFRRREYISRNRLSFLFHACKECTHQSAIVTSRSPDSSNHIWSLEATRAGFQPPHQSRRSLAASLVFFLTLFFLAWRARSLLACLASRYRWGVRWVQRINLFCQKPRAGAIRGW